MNLKIGYANVYVSDMERGVRFYRDTLGLRLESRDDAFGYASFDAGPVRMGMLALESGAENFEKLVGVHTGIAFTVPEIDPVFETLRERGVAFPMEPADQPWGGRLALFADPDGNIFYLDQVPDDHE